MNSNWVISFAKIRLQLKHVCVGSWIEWDRMVGLMFSSLSSQFVSHVFQIFTLIFPLSLKTDIVGMISRHMNAHQVIIVLQISTQWISKCWKIFLTKWIIWVGEREDFFHKINLFPRQWDTLMILRTSQWFKRILIWTVIHDCLK